MKKILKRLTVLGLMGCLLTFVGCSNPASKFAGEYEISDYNYYIVIYDMNNELVSDVLKSDANLIQAINESIAMIGTKVKLTAKYVLFRDSGTKFSVRNYYLGKPTDPENQTPDNDFGDYEIATNDEKLIIRIGAMKGKLVINITNSETALDEKDYQYNIRIDFKIGE